MDAGTYHTLELKIARDAGDARRVMPTIRAHHKHILDVGCGAGQTLIASNLARDVEAVGVDIDPEALALGVSLDRRIRFICSGGEKLPLPHAHFDLVLSRVAFPYMHRRAALPEMWRVLKPGGELWLTLHPIKLVLRELRESLARGDMKSALHRVYVLANGALSQWLGREFASPRNGRYESFQSESGMRRDLSRLGFREVRLTHRKFFIVTARKPALQELPC